MNIKCKICGREYPEGTSKCVFDGSDLSGRTIPNYNTEEPYSEQPPNNFQEYPPDYNNFNDPYSNQSNYKRYGLNSYSKADLSKRFGAYLLDGLFSFLLAIPSLVCLFIAAMNVYDVIKLEQHSYQFNRILFNEIKDNIGLILFSILLYFIPLVYSFIKDGLGEGQSWGKRIMGIMVVNVETNMPCSKGRSALRTLISGLIIIIPYLNYLTFWVEPIMVIARDDGRKLSDLAANTQVINLSEYQY